MVVRLPLDLGRTRPRSGHDARRPADRLAHLQDAVARIVRNPKLLEEAEKSQRYIDYRDPKAAQQAIERVINAPTPAQRAEIKEIVLHKYSSSR